MLLFKVSVVKYFKYFPMLSTKLVSHQILIDIMIEII